MPDVHISSNPCERALTRLSRGQILPQPAVGFLLESVQSALLAHFSALLCRQRSGTLGGAIARFQDLVVGPGLAKFIGDASALGVGISRIRRRSRSPHGRKQST
jgi:hypothetical protein